MEIIVVAVWAVGALLALTFVQNSSKLRKQEEAATQEDYLSVWNQVLS